MLCSWEAYGMRYERKEHKLPCLSFMCVAERAVHLLVGTKLVYSYRVFACSCVSQGQGRASGAWDRRPRVKPTCFAWRLHWTGASTPRT